MNPSQVVYVGDGAAYVPIPSLKNRPLSPNLQALQTLQGLQSLATAGGTGVVGDEDWRRHPETWDREHRRYRPNTTRVQRECEEILLLSSIALNFVIIAAPRVRDSDMEDCDYERSFITDERFLFLSLSLSLFHHYC